MIRINLLPADVRKSRSSLQVSVPWMRILIFIVVVTVVYSGWILVSSQVQGRKLKRLTAQWEKMKPERTKVETTEAALRAFENREAILKELKSPQSQWAPRLNILADSIVAKLWFTSLEYKPAQSADEDAEGGTKKRVKRKRGDKERDSSQASKKTELKKKKKRESSKGMGKESAGKEGKSKKPSSQRGQEAEVVRVPPPVLILKGASFVAEQGDGAAVNRYIRKLEQHPDFKLLFKGLKLKTIEHRQIQKEEVSDFTLELYLKGDK